MLAIIDWWVLGALGTQGDQGVEREGTRVAGVGWWASPGGRNNGAV